MKDQTTTPAATSTIATPDWRSCSRPVPGLIDTGDIIEAKDASVMIGEYLRLPDTQRQNPDELIFGFSFGLNKIYELLRRIEHYNDTASEKIVALRVYNAMSVRPGHTEPLPDRCIVPVLESGDDVYKVVPLFGDPLIIGGSRPCPNQCGFTFVDLQNV